MSTSNPQTKHEFLVRAPELHEVQLVQTLFYSILENSFPMFPATALAAYKKHWTEEKLLERVRQRCDLLQVVWRDGQPVGLVSGTLPEGGVATIIWLLVDAEYRNQQLGVQLLAAANEYYRALDCHKIKLTVPSERAKKFYLQYGFVEEGFHPKHWWNVDFWALAFNL